MSNQYHKIHKKPSARASFLLKLLKKRLQHSGFPVNFAKLKRTLFYRTPPGDCLCTSWHEVLRDVLALFSMTDFKEC